MKQPIAPRPARPPALRLRPGRARRPRPGQGRLAQGPASPPQTRVVEYRHARVVAGG